MVRNPVPIGGSGGIPWAPLALSVGALLGCSEPPGSPGTRPNVVLIVVDTLRADSVLDVLDLYSTPSMDALAGDGIVFSSAFASAPMTLPSHTALFSSRYPQQSGVLNNGQPVPTSLPLLAEWVREYGYESRAAVSLGTLMFTDVGLRRGFDSYDEDFWRIDRAAQVAPRIDKALDVWSHERPLFLFAHFSDPHEPYNSGDPDEHTAEIRLDGETIDVVSTSEMTMWFQSVELTPGRHVFEIESEHEFKTRWFECKLKGTELEAVWEQGAVNEPRKRTVISVDRPEDSTEECDIRIWLNDTPGRREIIKRYIAEVEYVDGYIGALIDRLKADGLYDSSLIIFTSDHGEALGEHKTFGHVQNLTDEMIKVPLIIKPPKGHPMLEELRERRGDLARHVDLVPTILAMVGIPPLPGQGGTPLLERDEDRTLVAETHKPEARSDKICLRDASYKMIYIVDEDRFEMFDLKADPLELENVFETHENQRERWPLRLRLLAEKAARLQTTSGEVDEETRRKLKALGYGG